MPDLPDIPKAELAIVEFTNAFRRAEKLGEVKPNQELTVAARLFAQYLAKSGRFAHEADGRKPADRAKAAGYKFCQLSENLALNMDSNGFTTTGLAGEAVEGWKNSPGHRKNMVDPDVVEIGVGIARAPDAAPKFLSVQLFGRPDSLKYEFRIENRSGVSVSYSVLGKGQTLDANMIATHFGCKPGNIVFERAGNWLTGARLESQFQARNGSTYILTAGNTGRIQIDMETTARKP